MSRNLRVTNKERDIIYPLKRYPLSTEEDPKKIFNFPFLADSLTISRIKNHGRVMFIVRGPPYTKKTKLSTMLQETYPRSPLCSAVKLVDHYQPGNDSSNLKHETVKCAIDKCAKLLTEACQAKKSTIIVQNTHMCKFEMQPWLDIAAKFDYIVIMAATTYKFDITPEALVREGGLDISYLKKRCDKWEDIPPLFTAWFISTNDSEYIRHATLEILKDLVEIQRFRLWIGTDDVASYFQSRVNLSCFAGYSEDTYEMKKYYFSKEVQSAYGRCFPIFFIGYMITKSDIIGVVQLDVSQKSLVLENFSKADENTSMKTTANVLQYGKTTDFPQKENFPSKSGIMRKKFRDNEKIPVDFCRFVHLAQRGFNVFSIEKLTKEFNVGLQLMSDSDGNIKEKYFGHHKSELFKLNNDFWFVNTPVKLCFSSIFTGLYA